MSEIFVEISSIVLKKKSKLFNACTRDWIIFPFGRRALFIIGISVTHFINGELNKDCLKQNQCFSNNSILMLNVYDDNHKHMSRRCLWLYHETSVLLNIVFCEMCRSPADCQMTTCASDRELLCYRQLCICVSSNTVSGSRKWYELLHYFIIIWKMNHIISLNVRIFYFKTHAWQIYIYLNGYIFYYHFISLISV